MVRKLFMALLLVSFVGTTSTGAVWSHDVPGSNALPVFNRIPLPGVVEWIIWPGAGCAMRPFSYDRIELIAGGCGGIFR